MQSKILEVQSLSKKFGKLSVVDDVSFSLDHGDIFGFLGPNGAGKTTTIRMMLGLLKPDQGEVLIGGHSIRTDFYKAVAQVGALVEGPAFYEYMTAIDNLKLFGAYSGGVEQKRIDELLELVKLSDRGKDKVGHYSLGMKQRLGIAQALLNNPKLLVLDEPINGLDPNGIKDIRAVIRDLSQQGITTFLSSHILGEVEMLCNKVFIINKGKKVTFGLTNELVKQGNLYEIEASNMAELKRILLPIKGISQVQDWEKRIRIVFDDNITPEEILINIVNRNLGIKMFSPVKSSLEDYFFDVVEEKKR